MRTFVAVPIEVSPELGRLLKAVSGIPGVKGVEPENVHITLKFLGELSGDDVERVKRSLSMVEFGPSFELSLEGIGTFPSSGRPRVVWIGIGEGKENLVRMHQVVDQATSCIGGEEREFSPHLTVARVKKGGDVGLLLSRIKEYKDLVFGRFTVKKVVLFKSTLTPKGPLYAPIEEYELA